jgi:hypothetical protein
MRVSWSLTSSPMICKPATKEGFERFSCTPSRSGGELQQLQTEGSFNLFRCRRHAASLVTIIDINLALDYDVSRSFTTDDWFQ